MIMVIYNRFHHYLH